MAESVPWLAFGIDLRLKRTEDGGRSKPLGVVPYKALQYRPNWRLPGMPHPEQVGAPVLVDLSLPLWEAVRVGDEVHPYDGARDCGSAVVVWVAPTFRPVPDDDSERFCAWAGGGPAPACRDGLGARSRCGIINGVPEVEVLGAHPVEAPEPCHLVEVLIRDSTGPVDLAQFTQDASPLPRSAAT